MKNEIYEGDIEITRYNAGEWEEKLRDIKKITGDLCVYGRAKLDAPKLTEVGGYLGVDGADRFAAFFKEHDTKAPLPSV